MLYLFKPTLRELPVISDGKTQPAGVYTRLCLEVRRKVKDKVCRNEEGDSFLGARPLYCGVSIPTRY